MYDDMRFHIQQMVDTGAIWESHSPWASAVVLVPEEAWQPEVLYQPQETGQLDHQGCIIATLH